MKIVVVSGFYSEGMGYTENCLPRALAALGHDVHVVTSNLNIYGNTEDYARTYAQFLGPADGGVGVFDAEGYTVHRLQCRLPGGYVHLLGLPSLIRELKPDVVHCIEIASIPCFVLAAMRPLVGYALFAETHQHLSVIKPFLKNGDGTPTQRLGYWLTRTLPTSLASLAVEKCYAIAPDCIEVATRFYGVPRRKTVLQSLGSDTLLFRPVADDEDRWARSKARAEMGYGERDIVCVYTGRFSADKNPLLLAQAVAELANAGLPFRAVFVGDGPQKEEILRLPNTKVVSFMKHRDLAELYRVVDIAVWPRQESMSMLDAAASGLPLVVSDRMGERERVDGNGAVHVEDDAQDLARVLSGLQSVSLRASMGEIGRRKMVHGFNWMTIANSRISDYQDALEPKH